MPTEPRYIVGAGGHARVVVDAILQSGDANLIILDSKAETNIGPVLGRFEVMMLDVAELAEKRCHVAIGSNEARKRICEELLRWSAPLFSVAHSSSVISKYGEIGIGCFVAAGSVIGPGATLGIGTILNHGAIVDHDCSVGNYCHIAPKAVLGGGVTVEDGVLLGAGAIVLPGVKIAANAIIGAGSVVTRDISEGGKWLGSPARPMERSNYE